MHSFNILIIEDESLIALELANTVSSLGYNVVEYGIHPSLVKAYVANHNVDLILMDINLGYTLNGIALYKSLESDIPVIYLTAYNDEKTITNAVKTDPLGYLIKPHKADDLKALLQLAYYKLQSKPIQKTTNLDCIHLCSDYYFDFIEEKLFFQDMYINLGDKELQLLKLLLNAKGQLVSFRYIENELWSNKVVSSSTVRTLIYRLRGKLRYKHIENVFNQGIQLKLGL